MLGRGLIADPALIERLRGEEQSEKNIYRAFHDELLAAYISAGWDQRAILCHIKEIWPYMVRLFEGSKSTAKLLRKAKTFGQYADAVGAIFALPLRGVVQRNA